MSRLPSASKLQYISRIRVCDVAAKRARTKNKPSDQLSQIGAPTNFEHRQTLRYTIDSISSLDATQYTFPDPDDRRPGVEDKQRKPVTLA
jgi:hypothetical protein